jgi:hypothetical protein
MLAEHIAVVPPFEPVHDHVQEPEPLTEEAVPAEHRLLAGAVLTVVPFALPHPLLIALGVPETHGYVLTDPGKTGTPPGTLTNTMFTFCVTRS